MKINYIDKNENHEQEIYIKNVYKWLKNHQKLNSLKTSIQSNPHMYFSIQNKQSGRRTIHVEAKSPKK